MWFVRIFLKNNIQEAYLPKNSISGKIFSEILAKLGSDDSRLGSKGLKPSQISQKLIYLHKLL